MFVELKSGVVYDVRWQYETYVRDEKGKLEKVYDGINTSYNNVQIRTYCVISLFDKTKVKGEEGRFIQLINTSVTQCSTDKFNKNKGRKLSLANSLNRLSENFMHRKALFNKEDRKLFWNEYFSKIEKLPQN